MIVVDASAAVDYLLRLAPAFAWVAERLKASDDVSAPHLLDVEVAQALRRFVRAGEVSPDVGAEALGVLSELRIIRFPHIQLLGAMWEFRDRLSAYDGAYVALARALDATLVTTDAKLARAARLLVRVEVPA